VPKHEFTEETVGSLVELGEVLQRIRNRLGSEDWIIKDFVFAPLPGYVPPKPPWP
jgi:hypothetical protein